MEPEPTFPKLAVERHSVAVLSTVFVPQVLLNDMEMGRGVVDLPCGVMYAFTYGGTLVISDDTMKGVVMTPSPDPTVNRFCEEARDFALRNKLTRIIFDCDGPDELEPAFKRPMEVAREISMAGIVDAAEEDIERRNAQAVWDFSTAHETIINLNE